jgi:DNA polymerase-1
VPAKKKTQPIESVPATAPSPGPVLASTMKGRIFLIDAMSFIFRAYHAMSRQRPMSTKAGLPTAAILVFVNMLRKLRDDFSPEFLAAVFDLSAPTFRDAQAGTITKVRKFDIKTQTFKEIEYAGYKANRTEMPGDLVQQVPYIRRALEAYGIPILQSAGYEADDLIGTLAKKAAADSYPVYVVSSDKDMLQLVDDKVLVLNPPKDNLIADAAKVEEILGVPPERVVDVMALRGDSIDNIPGAPGIGDKGSVELIKRFGSLEAALDRAAEVEKKTYRESLQNNRDVILLSKQLATIDTNAPVELNVEAMRMGQPNIESLRALFTELEFTTLLKELLPVVEASDGLYNESASAAEIADVLKKLPRGSALAVAVAAGPESASDEDEAEVEIAEEDPQGALLPLLPGTEPITTPASVSEARLAISSIAGEAVSATLTGNTAATLSKVPLRSIHSQGRPRLQERDARVAECCFRRSRARSDALLVLTRSDLFIAQASRSGAEALQSEAERPPGGSRRHDGPSRSNSSQRSRRISISSNVYEQIDLPLVPVLARMEQAGVQIDIGALATMSTKLEREAASKAREIYDLAGVEFNINSPKQLGDVLFNRLSLPKPVKYGKGRTISTAVDVLEGLAIDHAVARLVLEYRQLTKLKSTYVDALPALINPSTGRVHTTFGQTGTSTGRLSSTNPNLQNIPIRTELGREIRAAFIAEPGHVLLAADYSQIELRLLAHFSGDPLLVEAYRRGDDIHTLTASQVFGVPPLMVTSDHRRQAKVVNFGIVYGLSPFGLSQQLGIEPSEAKQFIQRTSTDTAASSGSSTARSTKRAAKDESKPCSAACARFRTSTAKIQINADLPSAPPSTRPCKERPPISSSWP